MRAIVCMKQVVDPLIPATDLVLDQQGTKVRQAVLGPPVINGFDEQALEAAFASERKSESSNRGPVAGRRFDTDVMKRSWP